MPSEIVSFDKLKKVDRPYWKRRLPLACLIIEDSQDYRLLLEMALQESHLFEAQTVLVSSLEEAKKVLAGDKQEPYFDLIISDLILQPDSRSPRKTLLALQALDLDISVMAVTGASEDALAELADNDTGLPDLDVVVFRKGDLKLDGLDDCISYVLLKNKLKEENMKGEKFSYVKYAGIVGGTVLVVAGMLLAEGEPMVKVVGYSLAAWGFGSVNFIISPGKEPLILSKIRDKLPF